MAEAVEPVERGAVLVVRAWTVENVADVKDPAQIVRVHISKEEPEPPLLPRAVRRVAERGEREGPWRGWRRLMTTSRAPGGPSDRRKTSQGNQGDSANARRVHSEDCLRSGVRPIDRGQ